jgi:D-alanyl-lipoteichoic acid acyltransferase DltB (MBOAT superfamily)
MPTNVVTERNFNKVFPAEQRQRFWTRVERSLDEIFGVPRAAADKY